MKGWPICWTLFKMAAMMSKIWGFFGDKFYNENLHFRAWKLGGLVAKLIARCLLALTKIVFFKYTFSFKEYQYWKAQVPVKYHSRLNGFEILCCGFFLTGILYDLKLTTIMHDRQMFSKAFYSWSNIIVKWKIVSVKKRGKSVRVASVASIPAFCGAQKLRQKHSLACLSFHAAKIKKLVWVCFVLSFWGILAMQQVLEIFFFSDAYE